MNRFKKIFIVVIMFLSLSTMNVLFVLHNNRFFSFFEDFFSHVSFLVFSVDISVLKKRLETQGSVISIQICNIKSSFFNYVSMLFDNFMVFCKFFNMSSLDKLKKKISESKDVLIDKLMHQSCDLLNSGLIRNTITILELESSNNDNQVCWVIQLGALRNFQKVLEIVDKLKMYNYPVYIFPSDYTDSKDLIRIFVGPYSFSKEYLKFFLDDLYRLSMLRGEIYPYRES